MLPTWIMIAMVSALLSSCGLYNPQHPPTNTSNRTGISNKLGSSSKNGSSNNTKSQHPDSIVISRTTKNSSGSPTTVTMTLRNTHQIGKVEAALLQVEKQQSTIHCQAIVAGLHYTLTLHFPQSTTLSFTNSGGACMDLVDETSLHRYPNPGPLLSVLNTLLASSRNR